MKNQQDSSKGKINFNLTYDGNYNDYYKWILNGFDAYEKAKLDLLTFKNTKFTLSFSWFVRIFWSTNYKNKK